MKKSLINLIFRDITVSEGSITRLRIEDAKALKRLSTVKYVSPSVGGYVRLVYGNKNWQSYLLGLAPSYSEMRNYKANVGRLFLTQMLGC